MAQQQPLDGPIAPRLMIFVRHSWARWSGAWRGRGHRPIPVFRPGARLANWLAFRRDPLGLLGEALRVCGDMARIPVMYNDIHLVHDPAALREILVDAPASFGRGASHAQLRAVVGDGLLTAEFERWVDQRRAAAPTFSAPAVRSVEATALRHAERWFERWALRSVRGEAGPLAGDLMALATQIAASHFFDAELADAAAERFVEDFMRVQVDAFRRLTDPWAIDPRALPARARITRMAADLAAVGAPPEIRRQAMTVIVTAPENPSNALAWLLYLLGRHPEIDRRAAEAARQGDDAYLSAVIHESLRLYPGGWSFERTALEDRVVAGYHLPAGAMVLICPYTLHRDPRRWPDPAAFRPERFLERSPRDLPPFSYMPFGAGPRRCTGDRYAQAVVTAILRALLGRFRVELDPRERGEVWPLFTLRPHTGVIARLVPR